MRPLIAALTESANYHDPTPRMLTHDQLSDSLEALTGFRWTSNGFDVLDTDSRGHRLLLGGVDGIANRAPQARPEEALKSIIWNTRRLSARHGQ